MGSITEPATLVTDYLLAAFAALLAWRLRRGKTPQRWWAMGLAATSVAGLAGGTVHGFVRLMPETATALLWLLTLEMLVLAGLSVVMSTIVTTIASEPRRRAAMATAGIAAAAYALWLPARPVFAAAIAAYGVSLLILAVVESPSMVHRAHTSFVMAPRRRGLFGHCRRGPRG